MKKSTGVALIALSVILAGITPLNAYWTDGGIPVATAVESQIYQHMAADGEGGVIIVWTDERNGVDYDIYAQRIDAAGRALWAADGVAVCTASGDQLLAKAVPDGEGGAIVTWQDERVGSSDDDIYAQRIDRNGITRWTPDGISVCSAASVQDDVHICSDGGGGAIIVWQDLRTGSRDIFVQRVNISGSVLWATDGMAVETLSASVSDLSMVPDGAGGAVIAWNDNRNSDWDIFAQRISEFGIAQWTVNGVPVCLAANGQFNIEMIEDGTGGAIMVWMDDRVSSYDIYASRVDGTGASLWGAGGIPVYSGGAWSYDAKIVSDGAGGAIVAWRDQRSGDNDIFAQKLTSSGIAQWAADGIPVASGPVDQSEPELIEDGAGGAYVAWSHSGSSNDIYAQRIDPAGFGLWMSDGVPVCTEDGTQGSIVITQDGSGNLVLSWVDSSVLDHDIYAQLLDGQGRVGYLPPIIASVADIPGDQGGSVNVAWDATPYDHLSGEVTEYTLWRSLDAPAAMSIIESGGRLLEGPEEIAALERNDIHETEGVRLYEGAGDPVSRTGGSALRAGDAVLRFGDTVLRAGELFGSASYWMLISTTSAYRLEGYSAIAPTLFDSTAVSDDFHYFQVIAHTSDPAVFWTSEPDSGYSVDNLAPCPPQALAGEQSFVPEGLEITWAPNTEPDLDCYNVYRGTGPGFMPSPLNLMLSSCDTLVFDGGWTWDAGYCYKIAAVDVHGNESDFSLLCAEQVTGDDPVPVPGRAFLEQNYPNPFNPNTTIAFGLKSGGYVNLSVYDAAGRLVTVLVNEYRPAGQYSVSWDGKAQSGTSAASGVYFYKLNTGELDKTMKMILMR